MKDLFQLDDDVAVVIGGTGELGGLMAEALGAFGAKVAVLGRNVERGGARAGAINDAGGTARFFAADSLDPAALDETRQQIRKWAGGPASKMASIASGTATKTPPMTVITGTARPIDATSAWRASSGRPAPIA